MGPFFGVPVLLYDGTNAEQIVAALGLEEGDGVIPMHDDHAVIVKANVLADMEEPRRWPRPWLN